MKRSFKLIIALVFICGSFNAQTKTFTLSLYFAINEISSAINFSRLDSLSEKLNSATSALSIYGYADFLNSDAYNLRLSQNRANAVKNYLLKKDPKIQISSCEGLGEKASKENNSAEGEFSQRRVDVVLLQKSVSAVVTTATTGTKKIGSNQNTTQEKTITPPTTSLTKDIEELKKGETLAIEGLSFIPGRHILVPSAEPILKELLTTLKENPTLKIEIQGHICCVEPEEEDGFDYDTMDRLLSENRAKAVYNYLIINGISEERLTYKGYGHKNPKIKIEKSPEDEQVNRRVEIKVVEN